MYLDGRSVDAYAFLHGTVVGIFAFRTVVVASYNPSRSRSLQMSQPK